MFMVKTAKLSVKLLLSMAWVYATDQESWVEMKFIIIWRIIYNI